MPELPDLAVYQAALETRFVGQTLQHFRVANPFVLRTVEPVSTAFEGLRLQAVERGGKQIILRFEKDHSIAIHLMIAGRFQLLDAGAKIPRGRGLAAWDFESHALLLTEAGKKRRAAVRLFADREALAAIDRGGLNPLTMTVEDLQQRLSAKNQTLKRALTDQRLLSGIGNAYSDEILWAAKLSPYKNTKRLDQNHWRQLHRAIQSSLEDWTTKLLAERNGAWPKKVTAFHSDMAVHGKYGQPCPRCSAPVQRIQYAEKNDANYCPRCQTGGRVLADRMLSKLLKDSWPKTLDELEG